MISLRAELFTIQIWFGMLTCSLFFTITRDGIKGEMAGTAETVGFQFAMFIATLTLYESLYSSIIA